MKNINVNDDSVGKMIPKIRLRQGDSMSTYLFREMLTCALKAQINDSNIEKTYWNVCVACNI
jgi:hypothetical protein